MKNKLFEEDKPFFLGYLVFGTFLKRWPDRLKVLQKRKEESPVIANEIDAAIEATEKSMETFKKAAEKYKAAAKEAKDAYDDQSGAMGKVKDFFGLEQGDPNKKIFGLEGKQFTAGSVYSMNDILSPDFNIGLFLESPLEGDKLKEEVMGNLLGFRKYYDPKTSSKIPNEEIENLQDETLDTFDPFKVFNPTQQESLIREQDEPSGTMLEVKNICKPKAEKAFLSFQQSMKSNPTKVNLTKQTKLLINNPYYAIYRNFEGYDTGKKQIVGKFPDLLMKVLGKIYQELYAESMPPEVIEELKANIDTFANGGYLEFVKSTLFTKLFKQQTKSTETAKEKEEKNLYINNFFADATKALAPVQLDPPLFVNKTEGSGGARINIIGIDDIYQIGNPFFTRIKDNKETMQVIGSIIRKNKRASQEALLKLDLDKIKEIYDLITKEDIKTQKISEMKNDLRLLLQVNFSEDNDAKETQDLAKQEHDQGSLLVDDYEQQHKVYMQFLEVIRDNKELMKKTFASEEVPKEEPKQPEGFDENLEEQIIKLIKPYLHERIKSKRIGATK